MNENELRAAQNKAYHEYLQSRDRAVPDAAQREAIAFIAGWRASDTFYDEQPVKNPDKFEDAEQLRAQAAIAAMQGLLANGAPKMVDMPFNQIPQLAVIMADLLIKELSDADVHLD